jgi:hypothetical protein
MTDKITPQQEILEFADGLYFIKYNKFFKKNELEHFNLKFTTTKYYNITYHNLKTPKT